MRHQRSDSSGPTQVIWDGDDPLAQLDTAGNLKECWSWGGTLPGGNWSRLVKKHYPATNPNPDQYAHGDWQGTVVALSLPNGTALSRSQPLTRPWGQETAQTPLSWLGNHGYWAEGQLARPMHYVRARWYVDGGYDGNGGAAVAGGPGWLSPDPLGFGGGDGNLYRYVGNRPTVGVDPLGTVTVQPVGLDQHWVFGRCGGLDTFWSFTLDSPTRVSGYIVQENVNRFGGKDCKGAPWGGHPMHFWEAFPVTVHQDGVPKDRPDIQGPIGNDDEMFLQSWPGKTGSFLLSGVIAFYTRRTTGDLGYYNLNGTKPGWMIRPELGGTLPMYVGPNPPDFWKMPPDNNEQIATRSAVGAFCCCPGKKTTGRTIGEVDANPPAFKHPFQTGNTAPVLPPRQAGG